MQTILEYIQKKNITSVNNEGLAINDILFYDAGYNMILPHFLRIIEINKTGKSCKVESLENELVDGSYNGGGHVIPKTDKAGKPIDKTFRIQTNSNGKYFIKVDGHIAELWNGKPMTVDMND